MKGKRQFWLAALALFIPIILFGVIRQARFKQLARHDLNLIINGNFGPGDMGLDEFKLAESRVSRRGHLYNNLFYEEYRHRDRREIKERYWPFYLFMMTKRSDPKGALKLAIQYKDQLDERLLIYDLAIDKKLIRENLKSEDHQYLHYLLQHRESTQVLISQIEHQIQYETP